MAALVAEVIAMPDGEPGTAVITSDGPGRVVVSTEAMSRQLLILAESYHPGWHIEIDGSEGRLMRVYGDFMGCLVDAGAHEVVFTFQPASLRTGILLSFLGLLSTPFFFLVLTLRRK